MDQRAQELHLDALDANQAADAACRDALEDGGRVQLHPGHVPVEHLVQIYLVRVRHLAQMGAETVGSNDVVSRLSAAEGFVQIASVDARERHFVVFIDPTDGRVVSYWEVPARHFDDDPPNALA